MGFWERSPDYESGQPARTDRSADLRQLLPQLRPVRQFQHVFGMIKPSTALCPSNTPKPSRGPAGLVDNAYSTYIGWFV